MAKCCDLCGNAFGMFDERYSVQELVICGDCLNKFGHTFRMAASFASMQNIKEFAKNWM